MVPEDSRTSVQYTTCLGLTAGFGMRPGVSRKLWPLSPRVVLLDLDAGKEYWILQPHRIAERNSVKAKVRI